MNPDRHRLYQQPWPEGGYRLFQLGFFVDDLFAAAERWAGVFGIGPFHVLPRMDVPCTYRGTQSNVDMQSAVAQDGPVQIELIVQYCDRPSIYRDLFAAGESGLHQLCTVTPDYDGTRAHYEDLGYRLVSEMGGKGPRVSFFDTSDDFGFMTEVVEESPGFLEQLARVSDTCSSWDGTDPIRLLTRDGYRTP